MVRRVWQSEEDVGFCIINIVNLVSDQALRGADLQPDRAMLWETPTAWEEPQNRYRQAGATQVTQTSHPVCFVKSTEQGQIT